MLRRAGWLCVRRKHGQKAWSPNASSSGAAPANGITAREAVQIAYRPMPLDQTVEYEEDFGNSLIIHREFVSKKQRSQMSFDLSGLAYSDVELRKARQQLASTMNRERRGVLLGAGGQDGDRVHFHVDLDNETRDVESARYLFNEKRMQYCDRFQTVFRDRVSAAVSAGAKGNGDNPLGDPEDAHYLFSLMEACAVVHGCDTTDAQEVYYRAFLRLDLDSLEEDEEALRARLADAASVKRQLSSAGSSPESSTMVASNAETDASALSVVSRQSQGVSEHQLVQRVIDELPPLFEDDSDDGVGRGDSQSTSKAPEGSEQRKEGDAASAAATLPEAFEEYAPLYKAYLAHASGESPVASYDPSTVGASANLAERRRWRHLMERLAREDFHALSEEELRDAVRLNGQLHTVKFYNLKVGDTVRQIMQVLQRETGDGSSIHRDTPVHQSSAHPERRV